VATPSHFRKIQILTGIDGVNFADCYKRHLEIPMEGMTIKFIGKDDLIENNLASGRPKDQIDADALNKLD